MILASKEKIEEYTQKGCWGSKTLLDYFHEHANSNPGQEAIIDPINKYELVGLEPQRVSYAQLDKAADAVATALLEMGIGKDDVVIVQMPNCWELAMLYLAIARAGALISPLPVQWRIHEIEYIARLTEAKAYISVADFKGFAHLQMGRDIQGGLRSLKYILSLSEVREFIDGPVDSTRLDAVKVDANDIFTLCWTSGTEAQPKGCPLSHNNWLVQAGLQIEAAGINAGDVQLTAGPLVNMASTGTTFIEWLMLGGRFVLHHPFDPELFIKQIAKERVNYTLLVPAVVNMIAKHPMVDQFDLSSVRNITVGSAPPSLFAVQEFKRRWDINIGNIWGQNEGTVFISGAADVPELENRVDSFPQFGKRGVKWSAKTANYVETKLIDPETGQEVTEPGQVGELAYRGPNVMPCYFRRPDLTEKSFDGDGFFYTGDLFIIKENNFLGFFEREKDIIIRGGFNISAQEIENILLSYPKIQDVAAVAMPDDVMGEKTCVYIVPKEGEAVAFEDVTSFMKSKGVAIYKLPERIEIIDEIPRNPVGKILKGVLREMIKEKMKQ
ncbi:MAG TPA: class I adenylate-forming enzyme family protein [Clostridia bacterium]|nr:class I adenylate-forming enzyme family protein [Clostridia bacterium]